VENDRYVSDVKTSSDLRGLRPLLEQWTQLIPEYCAAFKCSDNPWWYGERANLSVLAGAAWRLQNGWHALEEYPADKRRTNGGKKGVEPVVPEDGVEKTKKKSPRGRCDLYVSHRTTGFVIEAKQAWQNLSSATRKDRFAAAMTLARRDAGNLHADEADHRIGAVFVVPFIPTKALREPNAGKKAPIDTRKAATMVGDWIKNSRIGEHSGYAYVYTRHCGDYVSVKGDRVFPGVVLVLSRCKTGAKAISGS
jgi:hypothetical protein